MTIQSRSPRTRRDSRPGSVRRCAEIEGSASRGGAQPGRGPGRFFLADPSEDLRVSRTPEFGLFERGRAGQEFVEQDAERIDVAAGVDVERPHLGLLGAHVFEGADDGAKLGEHRPLGQPLLDRFGHAEVDHLGLGLAVAEGHQHVGWLDVAVDNPLLVGVLDRPADREEEFEPFARRQEMLVAVFGDRDAVDQFHHEVRPPGLGRADIEDPGDVGVIHHRQSLAFGLEPRDHLRGVHAWLDDFERHPAPDRLLLLDHEDGPHAALADLLEKFVEANNRPRPFHDRWSRSEGSGSGFGDLDVGSLIVRLSRSHGEVHARLIRRRRGSGIGH